MHPDDMRRLSSQRLIGPRFDHAAEVVGWLGAVQAQDYHGAKWAVGQRMESATDADLDAALDRGDILRTHLLRPTWHFVTPADIRWMQALTAPRVHALNATRYRQLDLSPDTLARASALVAEALTGGTHLTRPQIGARLADQGIDASGQRLAYIVMYAELESLICSGRRQGRQHTYALVDERAPAATLLARDEALALLASRFFMSHGPATAHDLAWWSGLTVSDARRAANLAPGIDAADLEGATWWMGRGEPGIDVASPCVRLLPNYDEYFSRDTRRSPYPGAVDLRQRAEVAAGRLLVHHVVIDGAWRGGWRRSIGARSATVELDPADAYGQEERQAIAAETGRYGRFLGMPVALS